MRRKIEEGLDGEGRVVERSKNIQGRMVRVHVKDQGTHVLPVFSYIHIEGTIEYNKVKGIGKEGVKCR